MNTYLIPTDISFVEDVARAIARRRMHDDASSIIDTVAGKNIKIKDKSFEKALDIVFEKLWNSNSSVDKQQKENYMNDALAAISVINLKLITST